MERMRQSARRKSIFAGRNKIAKACNGALEQLEDRRLLSTGSDVAASLSRHAAHVHHVNHVRHMNSLAKADVQRGLSAPSAPTSSIFFAAPSTAAAAPVGAGTPNGISVNFNGGGQGRGGDALNSTDAAGVVPLVNWNNVTGAGGTDLALTDATGTPSTATLTVNGPGTYSTIGTTITPTPGDETMNTGFIYSNGTTPVTVTVNNVPYTQYDVYVYELNDAGGRVETTTLGSTSYYNSSATPNDASHIDGNTTTAYKYSRIGSTTAGSPTSGGDYVKFAKVTGTSFSFSYSAPGNGYLNGFQIVENTSTAPDSPTNPVATPGNNSVALSWTGVADATTYSVLRGTTSGGETVLQSGITGTTFTDSTAVNGTRYFYTITATNAGGTSDPSAEVKAAPTAVAATGKGWSGLYYSARTTIPGPTDKPTFSQVDKTINIVGADPQIPPGAPAGFGGANFVIDWKGTVVAPYTDTYTFYPASDDGVELIVDGKIIDDRFNVARGRGEDTAPVGVQWTAGSQHQVEMIFRQQGGGWDAELRWSSAQFIDKDFVNSGYVITAAPALSAAGASHDIKLNWTAVAGDSYTLLRGTTPTGLTAYQTGLTALTYDDTAVTDGTTYYYQVVSNSAANGDGTPSNVVTVAAGAQPPVAPTNLSVALTTTQATVSWAAAPFATSYNVERADVVNGVVGSYSSLATGLTTTSYTDKTVVLDKIYSYRVTAVNASGAGGQATVVGDLHDGAQAHYYNDEWWKSYQNTNGYVKPSVAGADAAVIYPQVNQAPPTDQSGVPGIRGDNYSAVYTGKIHVDAANAGDIVFATFTDDDGYLVVNGQLVASDPGGHGQRDSFLNGQQLHVNLPVGDYDYQYYYSQGGGGSGATLKWITATTGGATAAIPAANLLLKSSTPAAPTQFTASAGSTFSGVPLQFTDNSTSELNYVIQRSTTPTFDPGTVTEITIPWNDNNNNTTVFYNDTSNTGKVTTYYRIYGWNFDAKGPVSAVQTVAPFADPTATGVEEHFYNNQWWKSTDQSTNAPGGAGISLSTDGDLIAGDVNTDGGAGAGPIGQGGPPSNGGLGISGTNFSTVITGKITITTAGSYTFPTQTDDDSYLYVDGVLVSADPGGHGLRPAPTQHPITLTAGAHNFQFYQSQGGGGWGYHLYYVGPDADTINTANGTPLGTPQPVPGSALTPLSDTPNTPTNFAASSNTGNTANLSWTDNSVSEVRFQILRSTKPFNDPTITAADITTVIAGENRTSITDSGLNRSTIYYYKINAQNFDGSSAFSTQIQVTTGTSLAVPQNPTAYQRAATGISVNWTEADNGPGALGGFTIQRSSDGTTFTTVGTAGPTATTFLDNTGLTVGTTYTYKVIANALAGSGATDSAASGTVTIKYLPVLNPIDHSAGFGTTVGATNLTTDPGIETPAEAAATFTYNPTGGAWTFTGTSGITNAGSGFGGPAAPEGGQYAFLQNNAGASQNDPVNGQTISQTVAGFQAGQQYVFSVLDAARGTSGGTQRPVYQVVLDPGTPNAKIVYTGRPTGAIFANHISAPFTTTAGSHVVSLQAIGGTDNTAFLDQVQILPYISGGNNSDLTFNGNASVADGRLRVTNGTNSETSSAFETSGVPVTGNFTTSFDFQFQQPPDRTNEADGFAFVLQSNNPTVLGGGGGSLGVQGLPGNSIGILFNMYNGVTETGIDINGGAQAKQAMTALGNPFHTFDGTNHTNIFHVTLSYDATTHIITETVVDTGSSAAGGTGTTTFTTTYNVDVAGTLGNAGNYAYVGFTGATGGEAATMDVLNWKFQTPQTTTPPTLLSTVFGDGTNQRSEVRQIKLTFDHAVTLSAGAVTISLLNTGGSGTNDNSAPTDASVALGTPVSTDGGITWTIPVLANTTFSDATSSLKDGIYTVTVHAANVKDAGNNILTGGDQTLTSHRLFGDINGSKNVNNADYGQFRNAFNSSTGQAAYVSAFDFDGNGVINNADYGQFRNRFNKTFTY